MALRSMHVDAAEDIFSRHITCRRQHRRPQRLLARFRAVRAATMTFCAPLTPEDMMVQSCAEASPGQVAPRAHLLVL